MSVLGWTCWGRRCCAVGRIYRHFAFAITRWWHDNRKHLLESYMQFRFGISLALRCCRAVADVHRYCLSSRGLELNFVLCNMVYGVLLDVTKALPREPFVSKVRTCSARRLRGGGGPPQQVATRFWSQSPCYAGCPGRGLFWAPAGGSRNDPPMEKRVPDDARDACLAAPYDAPDARPRPGPARLQKQILVAPALRATPSNLELSSPPRGSQVGCAGRASCSFSRQRWSGADSLPLS